MPTKLALPFEVPALAVLLAALLLIVLQWPVRRLLRWLLGPLFALEMTRLARRSTTTGGRCAYALALLAALYQSFPTYAAADREEIAKFAGYFSELFLTVQSVTVLLFVPLYFGGAVSDEKERRSLDFLLSAPLSSREIVLGKYVARVISMTSVVLAGLPVLALSALWGGVDLEVVGVVFVATIVSILSLGAVTMLCSVLNRRTVGAVAWAYVLTWVASGCLASPLGFLHPRFAGVLATRGGLFDFLAIYASLHGAVALLALIVSIVQLRRSAQPRPSPIELLRRPGPLTEKEAPLLPETLPFPAWRPIGRDALLWKERHVGRPNEPFFEAIWLYVAGLLVIAAIPPFVPGLTQLEVLLNRLYIGLFGALTGGLCLGLLIDVAGTITREREQRTLESLLVVPESRGRILRAKVLGAFFRRIRWLVAILWLILIGLLSGSPPRLTVVLLALLIASYAAFVAALSLLVAVLAQNTVRAYVISLVAVIAVFAGTGVLGGLDRASSVRDMPARTQIAAALNPVLGWSFAFRGHVDPQLRQREVRLVVLSAFAYLAAAAAMAAIARWRFQSSERYT